MTACYRLLTLPALLLITSLAGANISQCQKLPASSSSWNLSDRNLPLLNLTSVVQGNPNSLLVFPAPEFSFPLTEPLSFNAECDCYSLTVRAKTDQTLRVVQLWRAPAGFYRSQNGPYLELEDFGALKAITALNGTRYLFAEVAQLQYRCVSIHTLAGNYLLIDYTAAGLISQLRDSFSRTIVPTYQEERIVALTQSWINQTTPRSMKTFVAQ